MTKSELVKIYASRTNSSVVSSRKNVDILLGIISEELINEHPVLLTGFGRLFPQQKRISVRRNPHSGFLEEGKPMETRPKTIRFKPCKDLFERLNHLKHSDENEDL